MKALSKTACDSFHYLCLIAGYCTQQAISNLSQGCRKQLQKTLDTRSSECGFNTDIHMFRLWHLKTKRNQLHRFIPYNQADLACWELRKRHLRCYVWGDAMSHRALTEVMHPWFFILICLVWTADVGWTVTSCYFQTLDQHPVCTSMNNEQIQKSFNMACRRWLWIWNCRIYFTVGLWAIMILHSFIVLAV